jgi:hypothetical protein
MAEGKVKAAKVKVYPPPAGGASDGKFHVYVFDVFNQQFLPGKVLDNIERAVQHQRHDQERIYVEQEADPELFDLPFISSDPALLERVAQDAAYRAQLVRDLTSDARGRARRR